MTAQLAFDFTADGLPPAIQDTGIAGTHPAPYVSRGRVEQFATYRKEKKRAFGYPFVQLTGTRSIQAALVLDVDRAEGLTAIRADVPEPSWSVWHPKGGAHVAYVLETPVNLIAKPKPREYLRHVAEYYTQALQADPGYSGLLTDNPVKPEAGRVTRWGRKRPYSLSELASVIPFGWEPPKITATASYLGRNCYLFDALMRWAGSAKNRELPVLTAAITANQRLDHPLPAKEVEGIARSVERYREQWDKAGWHKPQFIEKQARRGRRSAITRGERAAERRKLIRLLREDGLTISEIMAEVGVSKRTVYNALSRQD